MNHYQKLTTMAFRVIGCFFLVLAGISAAIALFFIIAGSFAMAFLGDRGSGLQVAIVFLIYSIPTSIIGYAFFKLSPYLATKVCRNL